MTMGCFEYVLFIAKLDIIHPTFCHQSVVSNFNISRFYSNINWIEVPQKCGFQVKRGLLQYWFQITAFTVELCLKITLNEQFYLIKE